MRLLQVISSADPAGGGPIEWMRNLSLTLKSMGHTSEIASLDAADAPFMTTLGVPCHSMGSGSPPYYYTAEAARWVREHAGAYDAFIVHGLWQYAGVAVRKGLRGTGTPYFVVPHGMLDPWFKRTFPMKHVKKWVYWNLFEYSVLQDARCVLYTCEEERRLARESFGRYGAEETICALGTRPPTASSSELRETFLARYPELKGKRVLLFLSRIHPKKGCDILIEGFAKIATEFEDARLVIAGPDVSDWQDTLVKRSVELGIGDRVIWTGMLKGDEKWAALGAAEAFILPSHQETFPVSTLEALASGVPVLTTRGVNTWREMVEDGGALVDDDSVEGTARILQQWLTKAKIERDTMSEHALASFTQRYRLDAATRHFVLTLTSLGVNQ